MTEKELELWYASTKIRLERAIIEGDEQTIDDLTEELAFILSEMER